MCESPSFTSNTGDKLVLLCQSNFTYLTGDIIYSYMNKDGSFLHPFQVHMTISCTNTSQKQDKQFRQEIEANKEVRILSEIYCFNSKLILNFDICITAS